MIGGTVIETIAVENRVWINTQERDTLTTCAIYVESTPQARAISEGDVVWWQGNYGYWTAKDRAGKTIGKPEVKLKRIGFSGVKRPTTIKE